jgi:hypothetical protein
VDGSQAVWEPLGLDRLEPLLQDAPFRWWISGGYALELHVGDSWREHDDIDVGVCRSQLSRVFGWFEDWDLHVAADGRLSEWDGRPLEAARHENNVWARMTPSTAWLFDITVGEGDRDLWMYRRDRSLVRTWDEALLTTKAGLRYLAPDLQLLFKAQNDRSKDLLDAERVIPQLSAEQRRFLQDRLDPQHAWQHIFESTKRS